MLRKLIRKFRCARISYKLIMLEDDAMAMQMSLEEYEREKNRLTKQYNIYKSGIKF